MMVGQGMRLLGVGLVLGLIAALGTSRVLRSLLFQVDATNPAIDSFVGLLLSVASAAACCIGALRFTHRSNGHSSRRMTPLPAL